MRSIGGLAREQRISEAFVEFAGGLVDEVAVVDLLQRLVDRSASLLGCAAVGLMLADAGGVLRVMASAGEPLELLRHGDHKGPSFESYRSGLPVFSKDLAADAVRWPMFAAAALAAGFRSVETVPAQVRSQTVGALNLFRAECGRIGPRDLSLACRLADLIAIAVLAERAVDEARGVIDDFQRGLGSRVLIEQAKGVLAEREQIGVDEACQHLRRFARDQRREVSEIAREVIDGSPSAVPAATERGR